MKGNLQSQHRFLTYQKAVTDEAFRSKAAAAEIAKLCADDILFYMAIFLYTYRPQDRAGERYVPFVPWPGQVPVVLEMKRSLLEGFPLVAFKGRDQGFTEMALASQQHEWLFVAETALGVSSAKEALCDAANNPNALLQRFDRFTDRLPPFLKPSVSRTTGDGGLRVNNDNGSFIKGEATTPNMFRQSRVGNLLIDEFATVEKGQAVIAGITDSCPGASIWYVSTPKPGNNGFNYALDQKIGKIIVFPWWNHPEKVKGLYTSVGGERIILDTEYREDNISFVGGETKYSFPDNYPFILDGEMRSVAFDKKNREKGSLKWMHQEWCCKRFGIGDQFFDIQAVESHKTAFGRKADARGELRFAFDYDKRIVMPRGFEPGGLGRFRIWAQLDSTRRLSKYHSYVVGADVSLGTGASNTVIVILDRNSSEFVGEWVCPNTSPDDAARVAVAMCKWLGGESRALLIWDGNGPGLSFSMEVQKLAYGRLYMQRNIKDLDSKRSRNPGYFTGGSDEKQVLLGEMRQALGRGDFTIRSEEVLDEMKDYIYLPSGSIAPAALSEDSSGARAAHGDRVIAYALCCIGALEVAPLKAEAITPEYLSFGWREARREAIAKKAARHAFWDHN